MDYPYKLSVLLPCYNVEKYLDLSLWCLEQQWDDEQSMEIVFVNDCSTDGTLAKLQSFCAKHPSNTVLINKERNEGVAQARNDALKAAHGSWITFLDPDDALSPGAYQAMCNDYLDDDIDILSYETNLVFEADLLPLPHYKGHIEWEGDSKEFYARYLTNVTWIFIYSHDLLNRLNVSFPSLSFLEDTIFNLDVFLNDGIKVRRVDCKSHYYITRPTSLSSIRPAGRNLEMIDDIMTALEYMEQKKAVQDNPKVVDKITWKQTEIARRLVPIFIRCDQVKLADINRIRRQLMQWRVYPYKAFRGGMKHVLFDLLFRFPQLLERIRPLVIKSLGR